MAKYSNLINGLAIFQAHEGDQYIVGAEHDVIYGSAASPSKLGPYAVAELEKAGWRYDERKGGWRIYV